MYTIPTFRAGEREPPLQPRFIEKVYIIYYFQRRAFTLTLVNSLPVAPSLLDRETVGSGATQLSVKYLEIKVARFYCL